MNLFYHLYYYFLRFFKSFFILFIAFESIVVVPIKVTYNSCKSTLRRTSFNHFRGTITNSSSFNSISKGYIKITSNLNRYILIITLSITLSYKRYVIYITKIIKNKNC